MVRNRFHLSIVSLIQEKSFLKNEQYLRTPSLKTLEAETMYLENELAKPNSFTFLNYIRVETY